MSVNRSLVDAREETMLLAKTKRGTICPCCTAYVKLYARSVNSSMCYGLFELIQLWNMNDEDWVHTSAMKSGVVRGGDFAKLRYWGLIVAKPHIKDPSKTHSGYWRPTEKAAAFIRNNLKIPKYAYVFKHGTVQGFSLEEVSIIDAMGDHFHYEKMMRTRIANTVSIGA